MSSYNLNLDADVDWRNALPPHIVAQRAAQLAAAEAANSSRHRQMISNWPLPEDNIHARPPPRRVAATEGIEIYTPNRAPPPFSHLYSARREQTLSPQQRSDPTPLVSAQGVGNSRRALVEARENQAHENWNAFSPPPNRGQNPTAANEAREREVREQNERVRQQMLLRQAQTAQRQEAQRAGHAAALQRQTDAVRSQMIARAQSARRGSGWSQPSAVPIDTDLGPSNTNSDHHGSVQPTNPHPAFRRNQPSSTEALLAAQRQLEEEEQRILDEALRNNVQVFRQGPSPSSLQTITSTTQIHDPVPIALERASPQPALRHSSQPHVISPPYAEDQGTLPWIQRMADSIAFGEGGQQQLVARGMRHRGGRRHFGIGGRAPEIGQASRPAGAATTTSNNQGLDDGWELSDFSYEALMELGSMAVSTGLGKKQLERYKPTVYSKALQASTALHLAALEWDEVHVKALIAAGCDASAKNLSGETALDIAKRLLIEHEEPASNNVSNLSGGLSLTFVLGDSKKKSLKSIIRLLSFKPSK